MQVALEWITPNAVQIIGDLARVSAPQNQGKDATSLMKYLVRNKHWSPFEMANACFKIVTTRDIARQILRHRSFSYQEFSQRYADVSLLGLETQHRECRLQDTKNRQNSLQCNDEELNDWWREGQEIVNHAATQIYKEALKRGVAKEQARALLPEGLTPSAMYMNGTIRSWLHYIQLRCDKATQKEHRDIANAIALQLSEHIPSIMDIAMEGEC